ncbi:S9 family peptidase [Geminicoccaceae bacterium 1502E]|nr:S9 family peptidase [Geminicoccaceae bacterium 1502E]
MAGHRPIETYLDVQTATTPALAPDGGLMAFVSDRSSVGQVWLLDMPGGTPRQATRFDEKIGSLAFNPKSRDLLFTMDCGGDERHQLWLLEDASGEPVPLTQRPEVVHHWGAWAPDGRRIAYTANGRDQAHMDVHVMEMDGRTSRVVLEGTGWRQVAGWWPDGSALLVQDCSRGMYDQDLLRLDPGTGAATILLSAEDGARFLSPKWKKDGSGFFLITNSGREFDGLAFFDLASGELSWLVAREQDVEAFAVVPGEGRLAYIANDGGRSRLFLRDMESGEERQIAGHPDGVMSNLAWRPDGSGLVFALNGAVSPPDIWQWDAASGSVSRLTESDHAGLDGTFVEPEIVHVATFDGRDVPAFMFRPRGTPPAEGWPAVVLVHGGPEGQFCPDFRADVQYLLGRGVLVLAPNVRGSTGYGRTWQSLDDRRLRMDSVRDMEAVGRWAAAHEEIDGSRLCLYGRSYGGFMVLSGLTEQPDLWKIGVEFYGIANFVTLLETTGPWRRVLRAVEYGFVETDREALESFSPIHKAERIRVPLFVAHGMRDPRVPPSESEMIVEALEARKAPVEYVTVPDEGHGFVKLRNRRIIFPAMAAFIERHL